MIRLFLIFAFLFSLPAFAQRDTLHGRIMLAGANTPGTGVFVINKNTGAEVKTGAGGLFKITARNADRLVVYSDRTVVREFSVGKEWFAAMPYDLEVQPQGYELEEVVIDKSITPEGLGLVPEGQKRYTVAERRVKTAGDWNPSILPGFGMIGAALSIDPILNALSGRTKMLKKELTTERKEAGIVNIGTIYSDDEITKELAIPAEKVDAFLYYAVENDELMRAIKDKNDSRAKLELSVLAGRYLEMQENNIQAPAAQPATPGSQPVNTNPKPSAKNEN